MPETIEPPPPSSETSLERQLNEVVAEAPDSPRAFLLVVDGERAGRLHLLGTQAAIIGRSPDATIRLDDPSASAFHARITLEGSTFFIEDTASRNGTSVNGATISRHGLHHKDAIRVGETTLVFLGHSPEGDWRSYLRHASSNGSAPHNAVPQLGSGVAMHTTSHALAHAPQRGLAFHPAQMMIPQLSHPSPMPRGYIEPVQDEDQGGEASLVDVVRSVFRVLGMLRRYAWILVPLPIVCALIGWTSFYWLPASQLAEATIRLTHFKTNISATSQEPRSGGRAFFSDPQSNFNREELVKKTLQDLQLPEDELTLGDAADALLIMDEPNSDNLYKVSFTQPRRAIAPPVDFLEAHLKNYLHSEVEKSIKTLVAESEFLHRQLENVAKELKTVESEERSFKERHLDSLPERAGVVFSSRQALMDRKQNLETEIDRLRQQLMNTRQQLSRSSSSVTPMQTDVTPLSNLLISKRDALSKLKATGLTDQHPQVRAAQIEVDELEREINRKRSQGLSKLEWETDPRYQQLQQDAERIEGDLKVDQSELSRIESQLGAASGKVAAVPEVEFKLNDLSRKRASLQQLQGELFSQHRKTLVQIELETADVHGHYEIVSKPTKINTKTPKFIAQRIGLGLGCGVFLAALLIAGVEFRRFLRRHPEVRMA